MDFLEVFDQILVLFLILLVGVLARRRRVLSREMTAGITGLLLNIALPALIIDSLQQSFSVELIRASGQILLIALFIYLLSGLLALAIGKFIKAPGSDMGVYRFGLLFSNSGFMGYPVVNALFGAEGVFYAAIYNLPFNLIVFTLGILLISYGKEGHRQKIEFKMLLNPATIAVVVGFFFFLFSIELPKPLAMAMGQLAQMTTPLSMIVIGALLADSKFGSLIGNYRIHLISLLRLFFIPLITWVVLNFFLSDPLLIGVPTIIAAMPVAANTAILAQEYEANSVLASQLVFASTLLSIVSIPLLAYLLF